MTEFSQFDRDNMARWCTAAYINEADAILPKILASPRAGEVTVMLQDADVIAANALTAYQSMDYASAVTEAKRSYEEVLAAAATIPRDHRAAEQHRRPRLHDREAVALEKPHIGVPDVEDGGMAAGLEDAGNLTERLLALRGVVDVVQNEPGDGPPSGRELPDAEFEGARNLRLPHSVAPDDCAHAASRMNQLRKSSSAASHIKPVES